MKLHNMNNIQKRTLSYLQKTYNKTKIRWSRFNVTKGPITPIFNKRYENRKVNLTSKPQPAYKKYEDRNVVFSSKPQPAYKKYEDNDIWDIHHIQKYGGL